MKLVARAMHDIRNVKFFDDVFLTLGEWIKWMRAIVFSSLDLILNLLLYKKVKIVFVLRMNVYVISEFAFSPITLSNM